MLQDGSCLQVNQMAGGWATREIDDWVYYRQQHVGGCCAPSRFKPTGYVFEDDGSTVQTTGDLMVRVADAPLVQTVLVDGWYLQAFTDDRAVNLTLLPTVNFADKQSIVYGAAFDRAMIITYQFLNATHQWIGNQTSGLIRNTDTVPDITLPKYTRSIASYSILWITGYSNVFCIHIRRPLRGSSSGNLDQDMLISNINSSVSGTGQLYCSTVDILCNGISFKLSISTSYPLSLPSAFTPSIIVCICYAWCRSRKQKYLMSRFVNKQDHLFSVKLGICSLLKRLCLMHELFLSFFLYAVYFYPLFLCYHASYRSHIATVLDLPSFVITYAREIPFLVMNALAIIPTLLANGIVLAYFLMRAVKYHPCDRCRIEFLQVDGIEEDYVKLLFTQREFRIVASYEFIDHKHHIRYLFTEGRQNGIPINKARQVFLKRYPLTTYLRLLYRLFGMNAYVRIPYPVKISLTLLIYCLGQLIPVLTTEMLGVGGVVPTFICQWTPYFAQFQYTPNPTRFAVKTWMLMQIAAYISTFGAGIFAMVYSLGILRRVTKDIINIRRGDYNIFKGKKNNTLDLDDSIRFLGVCLGFGFTGTLYFMIEIALFGTGIAMLVQLDKLRDYVFRLSGYGVFFASFFVAWIFQLVQKRITRIVFIKKGTRFSLQNRSPLLHYWYFMMLTSMTRALTSYILRTLKLIVRYPLFSLRVDRNAETWSVRRGDGGFVGYMGMLLAENEYNNPIMLVFIECILHHLPPPLSNTTNPDTPCRKHSALSDSERNEIGPVCETSPAVATAIASPVRQVTTKSVYWRQVRARNRWFLAYTLINNPMLQKSLYEAIFGQNLSVTMTIKSSIPSTKNILSNIWLGRIEEAHTRDFNLHKLKKRVFVTLISVASIVYYTSFCNSRHGKIGFILKV
ncbi:hypothetical protein PHYBLDRAFT_164516 [Phycomyces blakesleeanus NRRL 1555(-)]|uniref:Uncharacterized protein n=1 Tax=Phycomyces blakesleeanus (strain ATCC 8743b / DSM 1359 / FGSC 10004 / NBRC 33097 / NRRL 1555) TaxID=763407 RepID=A0A162NND5_PHYB8|nr:hypothetical protein PHYBLDRAFT_164516 [Phycomyces blakesleeanus NRRL 1555(-)]OAD77614.1 hypothetical protein PHYBLDRAFT_164516 [Phycomyces blakesleeanus NRRL 1555(-)]|eukprot:XP_018295654.1 hypothetical protein PHYBLDRAFT_164516 [Phycomyces blakesleeanus NRRL 1555(-)]